MKLSMIFHVLAPGWEFSKMVIDTFRIMILILFCIESEGEIINVFLMCSFIIFLLKNFTKVFPMIFILCVQNIVQNIILVILWFYILWYSIYNNNFKQLLS